MPQTNEYSVIDPHINYRGKSYSDWACDWFNWFISANPNNRNSGPVVFLTSKHIPQNIGQLNASDGIPPQTAYPDSPVSETMDPNFTNIYRNEPNIRIGSNRLQIFDDQALLVPIITSYLIKTDTRQDFGYMQDYTGSIIDAGDNPPENGQLTIGIDPGQGSGKLEMNPIELGKELIMKQFRFSTPIFTTIVPEAQYGTSMKDFLEEGSIAPGTYPTMVDGYFVLIEFNKLGQGASKTFWIHSWASAGREARGPYFSELLYEVEISKRLTRQGRMTTRFPARFEQILDAQLKELTKSELYKNRIDRINSISKNASITLSTFLKNS